MPTGKKTDARVRYTKTIIRESFLELLRKKPVDRITVKELCDMAQINRATFYTHYNDCFDLLRRMEEEFLEQFQEATQGTAWADGRQLITCIYETVERNIELCDVLIFRVECPSLLTRIIEKAREHFIARWREEMPMLSEKEQDMLFIHLSSGLSAVMFANFKTCEKEQLIDFMVQITTNCLAPYRKG